jgi:catechol 2,3-dioxygenase-like lactoylglutathione lyase family enzyme
MTEKPSPGSANPGVHSLDHYALAVPDLGEAKQFYQTFGLEVKEEGGGLRLHTFGSPHIWGALIQGPKKRLQYLSFSAYAEDLPLFAARLDELGIEQIDPPEDALHKGGLWLRDLNGLSLQIKGGPKTTLDAKEEGCQTPGLPGHRNAALRGAEPQVRPTRLSHVLIFVPDVPAAIEFYQRALGVRLSDQSADAVAFMHARYGSDHHLIAFGKAVGTGFHHSSWDVPSINHVGRGAAQMQLAGYERGWGLGRHVLGSNYFHYVRDPWGSYAEYSHDIDYIPEGLIWESTSPPAENSLSLWGPPPPDDFINNYEIG